jgi:hypothetical protein
VVDLVGDQLHARLLAPPGDRSQLVGQQHGAGGVGRAGDHQPGERAVGVDLGELLDGRLEPGVRAGGDLHDLAAERGKHVAVAGVARSRDGDAVAHVERGEESEQEAAARAGRHDDVVGGHVDPVAASVVVGDRRAQLDDPDRRRVAERITRAEEPDRLCSDRRRSARARLSRQQVDQVAVAPLPLGRQREQVHHVERRHVGALGRGQAGHHDADPKAAAHLTGSRYGRSLHSLPTRPPVVE